MSTEPNSAAPDASLVADLLVDATRRLRRGTTSELRAAGLTWGQARALRTLARAGGPTRMSELASHLDVVPRSATDAVDALLELGFVERLADPSDGRAVLVGLTRKGRHMVKRSDATRAATAERMVAGLDTDERSLLIGLLARLRATDGCTSGGGQA